MVSYLPSMIRASGRNSGASTPAWSGISLGDNPGEPYSEHRHPGTRPELRRGWPRD